MVWWPRFLMMHTAMIFSTTVNRPLRWFFKTPGLVFLLGGSDEKNGKKPRVFFPRKISVSVRVSTRSKRGGRARVIRYCHQHIHILLCHVLAISNKGAKCDIRCGHVNVSYLCTRKEALRMASRYPHSAIFKFGGLLRLLNMNLIKWDKPTS